MSRVAGDDLDDYVNNLRKKRDDIGKFIDGFIQRRGNYLITGAIKRRLFNYGSDGQGVKLQQYSDGYKRKKQKQGLRSSPTTLKLTGAWYDSLFIQSTVQRTGEIKVLSNDEKNLLLVEKYGEDILTLTIEEQEFIIKELEEELVAWLNENNIKIEFT